MNNGSKKRGFVLHEALMAVAMAMALAVGIAQLLVIVAHQRRLARQYAVATREAGNLMEDLAARSWGDTATNALKSLELSEAAANYLPEANLSVDVTEEEADMKRITVEIEWQIAPERAEESVRLVGWKFLAKEEGP